MLGMWSEAVGLKGVWGHGHGHGQDMEMEMD